MGDLDHHLIHTTLGPLESITQTASQSVQQFFQQSRCDRPTDHASLSVTTGYIYVLQCLTITTALKFYILHDTKRSFQRYLSEPFT